MPAPRLLRPCVAALALAASSCAGRSPSPAEEAKMVEETEAELRRFGSGSFEVLRFTAVGQRDFSLTEYYYESKLHEVAFDAELRFLAPLHVRSAEEIEARVGASGWTIDERRRDLVLLHLFGAGTRDSGQAMIVHAAGMFDALEPGYRFRLLDTPHTGTSMLRPGSEGSQ